MLSASAQASASSSIHAHNASNVSSRALEVRDVGFTILADPESAEADVVFIHGLQGHPRLTWTYSPSEANGSHTTSISGETRKDVRTSSLGTKFKTFFRSSKTSELHNKGDTASYAPTTQGLQVDRQVYWPHQLFPIDFPKCRVMTYGYDSQVTHWFSGPAMSLDIYSYGESLLNGLEAKRRADPRRRLVFIVHSLGGLILKDMLRRARTALDPAFRSVYTSSQAIFFFGTPHRGGSYVNLGLTARKIVACMGFDCNDKVLRDLKFDSSTAKLLREEFSKMLEDIKPRIYTFQEGAGLKAFGPFTGKVVDDSSSALDYSREIKDYIYANHVGMCKFADSQDDGYDKVKSAMAKCLTIDSGPAAEKIDESLRQEILSTLSTPESNERFEQVENAWDRTCEFLFENKKLQFVQWLQSGSGIYWISGKPGSGKSTLMKFIVSDRRTFENLYKHTRNNKVLWAAFFFSNRGTEAQKSLTGLLQGILHSLLSQLGDLVQFIQPNYEYNAKPQGIWLQSFLRSALINIVTQQKVPLEICLFIDALDESSDEYTQNHARLLDVLDQLMQRANPKNVKVKLCLSSRPENVFVDHFRQYPGFHLHDYTVQDIDTYVHGRMSNYLKRRSDLSCNTEAMSTLMGICNEVIRRAQGVFLWVRLVMTDLIEGLMDGDSASTSQKHLSSIPGDGDLHELYHKILTRLRPEFLREAYCMLQIAQAAIEPLSLTEFVQATQFTLAPEDERSWTTDSPSVLERRITARCRGFLETQYGTAHTTEGETYKTQVVQFLHQSAKDFLMKTNTNSFAEIARKLEFRLPLDGHVFLLEFRVEQHLRQWRNQAGSLKDLKSFDILRFGIFEHARQIEQTWERHVIEAEGMFRPLDRLKSFSDAHDLATTYLRYNGWKVRDEWRPDFMSLAVMAGLVVFTSRYKCSSCSWKPLLHWAVAPQPPGLVAYELRPFLLSPTMITHLIRQQHIDIHEQFEGCTAFAYAFKEYQRHRKNKVIDAPGDNMSQQRAILRLLLDHGAKVDCILERRDRERLDEIKVPWNVHAVVEVNGTQNATCQLSVTPLATVVRQADYELAELLLRYKANYRALDGDDLLYLARNDKEMLQLVRAHMDLADQRWMDASLKQILAENRFTDAKDVIHDKEYHVRRAWH